MKARTTVIVLAAALAVSVGLNLFAATATITALSAPDRLEQRQAEPRRPTTRELIESLSPSARASVRDRLHAAAHRARPEFRASRQARRDAVAAAALQPMDEPRVAALLEQSRAAEARARQSLETDMLAILATLGPADRAIFARILNGKSRSRGREPDRSTAPAA